jgi:hypothetical protein
VYEVSVDPLDFDHMLVSSHSPWDWNHVSAGAGIVETTDGGKTWKIHANAGDWGMGHGIWFLDRSDKWLLGTQGAGYWLTTHAGASWEKVETKDMAHGGGQVYVTEDAIYVSSAVGTLRSTDGGQHWSSVGTSTFTTAVYGDGKRLYTRQGYAGAAGTFETTPETDGELWSSFGTQTFSNGPDEMAYDPVNRILYSSNWGDGLLAMRVPD